MKTSTRDSDIMGLQYAYANMNTKQDSNYIMKRYKYVNNKFRDKNSYDERKHHKLILCQILR